MIPVGATSSRTTKRRRSFSQAIAPGQEKEVVKYFTDAYADYPDVLTAHDMATMTGLHMKSFQRIIGAGHIKVLASSPRYIIPKAYFWEFIGSRRFIDTWSNSDDFIIQRDGAIIPVEVKSADNTQAKSLKVYIENYKPKYSIKLSAKNFGFTDGKKIVPLYAVFCV
jgi:hypothetical protein